MNAQGTAVFERLERLLECRVERHADGGEAVVFPTSAEEVCRLVRLAGEHSVPVAVAGSWEREGGRSGGILIDFDRMRRTRLPERRTEREDPPFWVEAEAGATWLELVEGLRRVGRTLAVYPTSAPSASVGGWVHDDGLGVGSFEFGRLRENVLAASVVSPEGELRRVSDERELARLLEAGSSPSGSAAPGSETLVVGARVRTRPSGHDRVFAAAFESAPDLVRAARELVDSPEAPLWHLGFVNPLMAAARGLRARYLLFGVYPAPRDTEEWRELRARAFSRSRAEPFDSVEAGRVWAERFYPVVPGRRPPHAARSFLTLPELPAAIEDMDPRDAFQGIFARSGEVLLLTLDGDRIP